MSAHNVKRRARQARIIIKYIIIKIVFIFDRKYKNTWLISERGDEARDNGYALYKHIKNAHDEITVKYVITKNSKDLNKIQKNDVLEYGSIGHIRAFLGAKYLISTHIQGASPEFHAFMRLSKYKFFRPNGKEIMLQHGVTKDYMTNMIRENNPNLSMITCATIPEYNYIKDKFGYINNEIKLTGFSRYDNLKNAEKNIIALMPTWRTYLFAATEDEFRKSDFYKTYQDVLNSNKIKTLLKTNNLKLYFYPHYEMRKWIDCFNVDNDLIVLANENYDIQKLICEAKILITDYSSLAFDFAYLNKPTLYVQFDKEQYRNSHYKTGYYDYSKDGFGPIVSNIEDLYKELRRCIEKPSKKKNAIFKYHDSNNSERIIREIKRL